MSTVMPGQFATRAEAPVRRLKNVDLPVLGAPTTATVRTCRRVSSTPASVQDR